MQYRFCIWIGGILALITITAPNAFANEEVTTAIENISRTLPLWTGIPFLGILLSIALFPLFAEHFWKNHFKKIAVAWALILAVPFLLVYKGLGLFKILEVLLIDYIPFIILLWGLYTVSGGIYLRGTFTGTPIVNVAMLAIGTVLASFMGTTGAAMLMIRPLLRANKARQHKSHIFIFLIFLVANIGGILTPLGDPPLFLGFIHGVPFFWTMRLLPEFLFISALLLVLFFIMDSWYYRKESNGSHQATHTKKESLGIEGGQNFLFLGGILAAVLISGIWQTGHFTFFGIEIEYRNLVRDFGILTMVGLSYRLTAKKTRDANHFNWDSIKEVGYLFFGIFITIIPVLMILRAGVHGHMGFFISKVSQSWHYFWMSGTLSSFLDNAPTYLTFFNLALGQIGISQQDASLILRGLSQHADTAQFVLYLKGISMGAVFMGANTYIGNAPNFMVKTISVEHQIKMPSFFGYMVWSITILVPIFVLVTYIFI